MAKLPFAALAGGRGVPGGAASTEMGQDHYSAYAGKLRSAHTVNLIQEGARLGDFLEFFRSGDNFESTYTVGRKIGEGGFGKVFEATHNVFGVSRAVKRLTKSHSKVELRKNELAALLALDHPHIVKLVEYYDEAEYLFLVFEECRGPDLLERIQREPGGRLSELEASVALRHILKALQCCHSQYRGHYDIKPENFMYSSEDLQSLVMIDLGMSSGFDRQRHKIKGTAAYMAPEFWDGIYGPEGDVWSCGVVLFSMLTGEALLPDVHSSALQREIKSRALMKSRLRYAEEAKGLSSNALGLLTQMLHLDRHARPTVREALNHPFNLASYEAERVHPKRITDPAFREALLVRERLVDTLRAVALEPVLKRVGRLAMAHSCDASSNDLAAERFVFRMLDRHGYGEISIMVLENDFIYRRAPIPEDLEEIFQSIDFNRDGYMSYHTFLAAMLPFCLRSNEQLCRVAFSVLDRGRDGFVDAVDLATIFGHRPESETCRNILAEVCPEEGRLSWEAFLELMAGDFLS